MHAKLYVGNLAYLVTEDEIRDLFSPYEPIRSIHLVTKKFSPQDKRGYGFVELDEPQASEALYNLDNMNFFGRNLRISRALGRGNMSDDLTP